MTGDLVYEQILSILKLAGFNVRAIIFENHSTNVWIFKSRQYFGTNWLKGKKIYVMYDSVHLLKNILPKFEFHQLIDPIIVPAGEMSWNLHPVNNKLRVQLAWIEHFSSFLKTYLLLNF